MRTLDVIVVAVSFAQGCVGGPAPPPHTPYHLLLGPYEYELTQEEQAQYSAFDAKSDKLSYEAFQVAFAALPRGKHVPRYYILDDKHYTSIDGLKTAIVALPGGSTVYLRGSCRPYSAIELPPRPISLTGLRSYCSRHHITFTSTFGPGGY
jgi:hypothetical protein